MPSPRQAGPGRTSLFHARGRDKPDMLHFFHMKIAWNWKRWPFAAAAFALAAVPALAHEKWFATLDARLSRPVFELVSPAFAATIILLAGVGFILAAWLDRRYDGSRLSRWFDAKLAAFK